LSASSWPVPDWGIWLKANRLSAPEAIALTFGIHPWAVRRDHRGYYAGRPGNSPTLISGFEAREMLYLRNHERLLSPRELARWALEVGWNIPLELAGLVPDWKPAKRPRSAAAVVDAALAECVVPGIKPSDLRKTVEQLGGQFVRDGSEDVLVIPNGTVAGDRIPLARAYSALSSWWALDGSTRVLGDMLRGCGASGGGAPPHRDTCQTVPLTAIEQQQAGSGKVPAAPTLKVAEKVAQVAGATGKKDQQAAVVPPQEIGTRPPAADWKGQARAKALAIIARQKAKDLYPSQADIACEIARDFRDAGIFGEAGKPLTGSYIKRHALKGISSEQGEQR
jgi:hypothetical protein